MRERERTAVEIPPAFNHISLRLLIVRELSEGKALVIGDATVQVLDH